MDGESKLLKCFWKLLRGFIRPHLPATQCCDPELTCQCTNTFPSNQNLLSSIRSSILGFTGSVLLTHVECNWIERCMDTLIAFCPPRCCPELPRTMISLDVSMEFSQLEIVMWMWRWYDHFLHRFHLSNLFQYGWSSQIYSQNAHLPARSPVYTCLLE